jgi:hypothetical protein
MKCEVVGNDDTVVDADNDTEEEEEDTDGATIVLIFVVVIVLYLRATDNAANFIWLVHCVRMRATERIVCIIVMCERG